MPLLDTIRNFFLKNHQLIDSRSASINNDSKLNRENVRRLIENNGGSEGLDLSSYDLSGANLRRMNLTGVVFSTYNFGIDNYATANLSEVDFTDCNLSQANLSHTTLERASFWQANLTEASLAGAKAISAGFGKAVLFRADLFASDLSDANLWYADLREANLAIAKLSNSIITGVKLGDSLLQESIEAYDEYFQRWYVRDLASKYRTRHFENRYRDAAEIYMNLHNAFLAHGRFLEARKAYLKQRRMRKKWARQQAQKTWKNDKLQSIQHWISWLADWLVELLCDYGESLWRVIFWIIALLFVIGPILLWVFGGLTWTGANLDTYLNLTSNWQRSFYGYFQGILYMLDVFTTADFSELAPRNDAVRIISGFMAMFGIFLVGLLGFVAGNRIRDS